MSKGYLKARFIGSGFHGNNIFDARSLRNRDNCLEPFYELRKLFIKHGIELNTPDLERKARIQFDLHLDVQKTVYRDWDIPRYVLLYESPQIRALNDDAFHLERYRRVFTWRDELVDGERFVKLNLPNSFVSNGIKGANGRQKLCCLISANKSTSRHTPLELYSERVNTIRWFEKNAPHDFDLFGSGWNSPAAKSGFIYRATSKVKKYLPIIGAREYFPSYRGKVDSKLETLREYRFSICYENIRDLKGYITEKIWDSFFAGCVPVYWGASNITKYIPEDCFLDRRLFLDHNELHRFMVSMSDTEFAGYQERIAAFLGSGKARPFSSEIFAETVVNTIITDLNLSS